MQTGKKTIRNSSNGRYMDFVRPAKKKPAKATKKPAIIKATRITNEVFDPEIDDIESINSLKSSVVGTSRSKPEKKPASVAKPRPVKESYPFIASVNVDKRPLSPYVPSNNAAASRPTKNVYSSPAKPIKKVKKLTDRSEKKATKVVEPSEKSGLSLAIIIIITVILGAAAGIGAYLLLPH